MSEAVGAEVAEDEHGPFARAKAPQEAPPNPATLLVVQADGMRIRELPAASDTATAETQNRPSGAAEASGEAAAGWTECKVGVESAHGAREDEARRHARGTEDARADLRRRDGSASAGRQQAVIDQRGRGDSLPDTGPD